MLSRPSRARVMNGGLIVAASPLAITTGSSPVFVSAHYFVLARNAREYGAFAGSRLVSDEGPDFGVRLCRQFLASRFWAHWYRVIELFCAGALAIPERLPAPAVSIGVQMLGIPRRHSHFVYGVIQSGLTCGIAAAIASLPFRSEGAFATHWLSSWLISWFLMLPIVLFAAPAIRFLTHFLTRDD